jgi:ABC-type antimicrobial peptide transport system permease subunit
MNFNVCSIAIVILLSSVFMMFLKDHNLFIKFMNTLNGEQKEIYHKIIRERLSLYFGGMLLGILIGLIYLFYTKKSERSICIFIIIVFLTKMIVYKGYPKSTYMLYHLDKKEQVSAWTDIYTYMKKIWMLSFILAIISYVLIGYSFKM